MIIRRLLLFVPLALLAVLLQSCLWVPTYFSPERAGDSRADGFVEASIGDARLLNPILNADTVSSRIVSLTFDGLLSLDEDLNLVPILARSWTVSERVYIAAPGGDAQSLRDRVQAWLQTDADQALRDLIVSVGVSPAIERQIELPPVPTTDKKGDTEVSDPADTNVTISILPRLQLDLSKVTPDIDRRLKDVLGEIGDVVNSIDVADGSEIDAELLRERVPAIEHNPVVSFELRDDVKFHDGHPFDASDVVFTWRAIMNPRNLSPRTSTFEPIADIEVETPYRIHVVYKRLFSPAVLAWGIGILPEHLLNDAALDAEIIQADVTGEAREAFGMRNMSFNRDPIGTGAYRFVEWMSDELIRLKANDEYWDGAPGLSAYTYRVMPDPLTHELDLNSGVLDVYTPQPYQVERFRKDERFSTLSLPGDGYSYIAYNTRKAPFDDPRVRRALSMAINIDEIIKFVLYGEGERATGPYPVNTRWNDANVAPISFDPAGAAALLEEAGFVRDEDGFFAKDGKRLEFNLITNQGNPTRKAILSIAQDAWRRVGVKVNTSVFEWAVFLKDFVNPGKFDALVLGWKLGSDPDLYQLWHSSQTGPSQLNFTGYANPEVDGLIESIRSEYDADEQERLTHAMHAIIARDQPYTFLFAPRKNAVLNRSLRERHADGTIGDVREVNSGQVYQNFTRWTKAELTSGTGGG